MATIIDPQLDGPQDELGELLDRLVTTRGPITCIVCGKRLEAALGFGEAMSLMEAHSRNTLGHSLFTNDA